MNSLFFNEQWYDFMLEAWRANNAPASLHPDGLYTAPVAYDANIYRYLEANYSPQLKTVIEELEGEFKAEHGFPDYYRDHWEKHYNENAIWKQTVPFLVFARLLKVDQADVVDFAKPLVYGHAIPAIVVDIIIDYEAKVKDKDIKNYFLYSIISIINGLGAIGRMKYPQLMETYPPIISFMYERMWKEYQDRFQLPPVVTEAYVNDYLFSDSRIVSSVFFGIAIESAYGLTGKKVPDDMKELALHLRRARQLIDELLDYKEDLMEGLLTAPVLMGLSDPEIAPTLREHILELWRDRTADNFNKLNQVIMSKKYIRHLSEVALGLLMQALTIIQKRFTPAESFELCLLLNIRLGILIRLEQNNWEDVDGELLYIPSLNPEHAGV